MRLVLAALSALLVLLFALPSGVAGSSVATAGSDTARIVFTASPEGNEARYRVREQLARLNFPNDAVGVTQGVEGRIVISADGAIDRGASSFTIDFTSLTSDSDRRDNFLRRNTLQTADHPTATLVPTAFRDLPSPLPTSGSASFVLEADFVLKGETHRTLWDVTARFENGVIRGLARTVLTFEQIDLAKPRVASVLSVADEIRLEYDFVLTGPTPGSR